MGERAGHKKGRFHWGWWSIAGQVIFRSCSGSPTKCGSLGMWQGYSWGATPGWWSNWPHCARFVQLPLGHLGSTLQTSSGRHLLSFEQILCFSLCPQMQGFETTDVLCFLLKKRFFPWGLIVARRVKWQKELGVLKLRSMCGAPEAYQVSIRNRLFLFSGHWVVCFEIFIL